MITVDDINAIIRRETTPEMLSFLVHTRNNWPVGSLVFGPMSPDVVFDAATVDFMSKHVDPLTLYTMMIDVNNVDLSNVIAFTAIHMEILSPYYMFDIVIMRQLCGGSQKSPIVVARSTRNSDREATLYFRRDCICKYDYDASVLCEQYEKHRKFIESLDLPHELKRIKNVFDDTVDISEPLCELAIVPDRRIKHLMSTRPDILMKLIDESKDSIETLIQRFKQIDTRIEQYYGELQLKALAVLTVTGQLCLNPYMAYCFTLCDRTVLDEISTLFEKYPALQLNYVPTFVSRNTDSPRDSQSFLKYCPVYYVDNGILLPPVDTMLDDPDNMSDEMRDAIRQMHAQIDTYKTIDGLVPKILQLYAYV